MIAPLSHPHHTFTPMKIIFPLFALLFLLQSCPPDPRLAARAESTDAYIGTYTRDEGWVNGKADGIYKVDVNPKSGVMSNKRLVKELTNPSFVKEGRGGRYLYAISELARTDEPAGALYVFDVADDLREIARLPTDSKAACHVALDRSEEFIMTTNYLGGVAKLFRQTGDEVMEVDEFRVSKGLVPGKEPHLHSTTVSPSNRVVAIADLGLDRVWLFTLDRKNGKLIPHDQPFVKLADGAGPRHTTWSADGRFLYVMNELNSTVNVLDYSLLDDRFTIAQTITTLPAGYTEKNSTADIHLSPDGRFLYGSNRGHNSIVMYAVDQATGKLTFLGHHPTEGDFPRNFAVAPTGKFVYVANQNTGNISVHKRNEKSGLLTFTGQSFPVPTPVCIEF